MSRPPASRRPAGADVEEHELLVLGNAVLKRDAARTDYLVLPLAAGILARLVLALDLGQIADFVPIEAWPDIQKTARLIIERCAAEEEDALWTEDAARYGEVGDFALAAWPAFTVWTPLSYGSRKFGAQLSAAGPNYLDAAVRWLRANPGAPLLDMMLVAELGVVEVKTRRGEHPFLSRAARAVRVELAKRLRADGLTSWPRIVRAAAGSWTLAAVERLGFDLAMTAHDLLETADKVVRIASAIEARFREAPVHAPPGLNADTAVDERQDGDEETLAALEVEFRRLQTQNRILEEKAVTLQHERNALANRHARAESRAVALTENLASAQHRVTDLEWQLVVLARERDELVGQVAVEAAFAPGAPPLPTDALAGRRVLLFTGQAAADAREAMRQSFHEYGAADVTCYWTDKGQGPDRVLPDAIVVVDITFMSHSSSEAVTSLARKSGAWCCQSRRGSAMIAREVVARFLARSALTPPAPPASPSPAAATRSPAAPVPRSPPRP